MDMFLAGSFFTAAAWLNAWMADRCFKRGEVVRAVLFTSMAALAFVAFAVSALPK